MGTLGEYIRAVREERGLSVRGFARQVGISPAFVVDIEAGNRLPSSATLAEIAEALGADLADLQALDPRLPDEEREAFRCALAGDRERLMFHLEGLDGWRPERMFRAAEMLREAITDVLAGRSGSNGRA